MDILSSLVSKIWFSISQTIRTVAFEPVSTRNLHIPGDQTQCPAAV